MSAAVIWAAIVKYGPMVITAASAAAAVLPKPTDGTIWSTVRKVLDWAALNVGNSKNAQ